MNIKKKILTTAVVASLTALLTGCKGALSPDSDKAFHSNLPITVALASMDPVFQDDVTNLNVIQRVEGESPDNAVVVIEESLLDDSIAVERVVFSLVRKEGQWEIKNQVKTWQCHLERGHQDFSDQLCH